MELKDKVVLITGSSTGIGKETAIFFAEKGAKVIITSHNASGKDVLKECEKHGETCVLQLDVTDDDSIKKLVKEIKDTFGGLDILINNAGYLVWKHFAEQSFKDIENQVSVNVTGLFKLTTALFPLLKKQKEAMIINIASIAGQSPFAEIVPYSATKFAVRGYTQGLAMELPKHIITYAVNPGLTATKMTDFKGVDPKKVGEVIVKVAEGKIKKTSGSDVNVEEYI